ncbi:ribonuclease PH [Thermotomaculum hydrothermale]|uniref:Ribonuclease PH n=1 Tax=Thermotomaculum hydrothermale TaxID=981385 RepID=A0A7R6SY77_9BACT|nr:ribonuclease PH [Thermotomaculum hydrothermale]BBB32489.1 ribonuclease PH [Thermotomaculum hydrothermale]
MERENGRKNNELREVKIIPDFLEHPDGSCLISFGKTKVICSANIEEKIPPFLQGSGEGWITAEYGMLPGSTHTRSQREAVRGKQSGRTVEIQRLIGRALRASVDRKLLGERTILIDCDVIQADGGTRTASITGSFVAMAIAIKKLLKESIIEKNPILENVAAVSVGKVNGEILLDLDYSEDSNAEVDLNLIATQNQKIVEIQGTAETHAFPREELNLMLDFAFNGIESLINLQNQVLKNYD